MDVLSLHDIQFIWAVFSALPPGTRPDPLELPYAEGKPSLGSGPGRRVLS